MSGGQQINVGQGIVSPVPFRPYLTIEQGTLTPAGNDVTVYLGGEEAQFEQGFLRNGLEGQSTSIDTGTPVAECSIVLLGQSASFATGNVIGAQEADDTYVATATGSIAALSVDVALSGIDITSATGTVTGFEGIGEAALNGEAVTGGIGSFVLLRSIALNGLSITVATGVLTSVGGIPTPVEVVQRSSGGRVIGRKHERDRETIWREAKALAYKIRSYDVDLDPTQILHEVERALNKGFNAEADMHVDRLRKMLQRAKERHQILQVIDD